MLLEVLWFWLQWLIDPSPPYYKKAGVVIMLWMSILFIGVIVQGAWDRLP
jgi:hypothetical protein